MGSHSVTCDPTQVNTARLNPSQSRIFDFLSHFQDGCHDVISHRKVSPPTHEASVRRTGRYSIDLARRDGRL